MVAQQIVGHLGQFAGTEDLLFQLGGRVAGDEHAVGDDVHVAVIAAVEVGAEDFVHRRGGGSGAIAKHREPMPFVAVHGGIDRRHAAPARQKSTGFRDKVDVVGIEVGDEEVIHLVAAIPPQVFAKVKARSAHVDVITGAIIHQSAPGALTHVPHHQKAPRRLDQGEGP